METKSILQLAREAIAKGLADEQIAPVLGVSSGLISKVRELEANRKKEEQRKKFLSHQ